MVGTLLASRNVTPKVNVNYTRPALYPKQAAAIFCGERLICIEASTKSGKTYSALVWIFECAILGVRHGIYWWVAPIYAQSKIAFLRLSQALHGSPIVQEINRSEMVITLINGAAIHFKSGDRPDGLFGEDVNGAVIDEASRLRIESFTAIRSTLTATRGPIVVIGNVRGKLNWFYKLCRRIERKNLRNSHYAKLTAYDAARAGVIEWAELRDAQNLLPDDVFRELYLAEATEEGSNPFGIENIENCTLESISTLPAICYGIDLGKSFDYSVIIGLDKFGQVCYLDRFQKEWTVTINDIISLPKDIPMMIDASGVGNAPVEIIQKTREAEKTFGFVFTKSTKQPLMTELSTSIARQEIWYPDGIIKDELNDFEFEYTRTGVLYSAPYGFHDDTVSALALANRMRNQLNNQPFIMISHV
jgi:hypothetical protein